MLINLSNSILLIIDVQQKLISSIKDNISIVENIFKLVKIFNTLDIPIIYSEQYPKGLGKTVEKIKKELNHDNNLIIKDSFSCWEEDHFMKLVNKKKRNQIIICGIETHICVLQTALDLVKNNFSVFVVRDAVGSRAYENHNEGVNRMKMNSIQIVTLEMVLFELLKNSKHKKFKELSSLIK